MVDLPQHAGQISLLKSMFSETFEFRKLLDIQLLTPYWLGYGIIYLLSIPLGVVTATKLTVALALAGFPLSADRFLKSQHANPYWSWLLIPATYGFAFEWGFLNFLIAVPLGFLFLSQLKLTDKPYTKKELVKTAIWCHVLFFAHALVMVVFISIAALLLHKKKARAWLSRLMPLFSITPIFSIWFLSKIFNQSEIKGSGPWGLGLHRVAEFIPSMIALPATGYFIIASTLICTLIVLTGRKPSVQTSKIAPFILYTAIMMVGPNYLFGTFFVYNRFSYIGLPLFLIMFTAAEPKSAADSRQRNYLNATLIVASLILISYQALKIIGYAKESIAFQKVLEKMEPEKRALGLVFFRNSAFYTAPTYLHYPVWYQATRQGLVDFNFASFFPQVVKYKPESLPPADPNFVWMPQTFQWQAHEKYNYTYFLVKHPQDLSMNIFPGNEAELIMNTGEWWLYKNTKDAGH